MTASPRPVLSTEQQFRGYGILILVVPFVVYLSGMVVGEWLQGLFGNDAASNTWYPYTYSVVIGLTLLLMLAVGRGYFFAQFRIRWLSVFVGALGFFVWIGLWRLDRELLGVGALFSSTREAFNPFVELSDNPTWMKQFLAIRFVGLVAVVPIIEEFFLRGFLMRYIDSRDWDRVPLGNATRLSVIGVALYALVSHPAEPLAAVVWFSMVTWLYARTQSIWDCVVAHATTNLSAGPVRRRHRDLGAVVGWSSQPPFQVVDAPPAPWVVFSGPPHPGGPSPDTDVTMTPIGS